MLVELYLLIKDNKNDILMQLTSIEHINNINIIVQYKRINNEM